MRIGQLVAFLPAGELVELVGTLAHVVNGVAFVSILGNELWAIRVEQLEAI